MRSQILELEVRRLAVNLASLSGVFLRYDAQDAEILRFGIAYTMLSDADRWKIVVATAHDALASIRSDPIRPDPGSPRAEAPDPLIGLTESTDPPLFRTLRTRTGL